MSRKLNFDGTGEIRRNFDGTGDVRRSPITAIPGSKQSCECCGARFVTIFILSHCLIY